MMPVRAKVADPMRAVAFAMLAGLGLLCAFSTPLPAQEGMIEVQVQQIAGANIYLDAGREQSLVPGVELVVLGETGAGEQTETGRLRVIESTSAGSVTTFVGQPFPVTRGATLRLRVEAGAAPAARVPGAAAASGAVAAAEVSSGRASSTSSGSRGPRVSGSLGLSFDARQTTTSWDEFDIEQTERTFSTPTAALRLAITELPGGIAFRTNLRASYRASTDDLVQPQDLVRIYSLQLSKDFGMVQGALGRLYNPYEPMSGYFDGAYVHVGRREGFGGGVAAGFRPSREDAGITDSLPKLSAFVNYSDRTGPLKYEGALSFTHEKPSVGEPAVPGYRAPGDHSYIGLTQTLRTGPIRIRQSLTVDRDGTDDTWRVGRLLLGLSARITSGVTAHARYSLRQPYRWEQAVPVTYRRGRANLGLTYGFDGATVGADVTMNDVTDLHADDGAGTDPGMGWTYSGWFSTAETSLWGLGFSGSVSYRDQDGNNLLYVMPGLTRRFGSTRARLTYTFYRTEEPAAVFVTHTGDLAVDFPIARRLRGTLAGRLQQGAQLDATSIYASLWWAF